MNSREWFYDDDFWKHYAPIIFDENRMAEAGEAADAVTRLARLDLYDIDTKKPSANNNIRRINKKSAAPRILDLCCGPGRMSLEFARRGFNVTAVDISTTYLETARRNALNDKLGIEFIQKDIRVFKRKAAFDVAVNLYNSFGYFEDPSNDLLCAKNAFYSLKEGGAFIIEVLGKEIAVRDYISAEWFERAGFLVLTESEPVDSWASIWNRWIIIKNGQRREKIFIQRLYAASELRRLLLDAGFTAVELYGSWDEAVYDCNAKTLIAVGRKGSSS